MIRGGEARPAGRPQRDDSAPLRFVVSDVLADETATAFEAHAQRIRERLADVEVRHRGATSVAGVLTLGDVDVHVRTDPPSFQAAREALGELYETLHPDMWSSEAAFFSSPESNPRVEVALTTIGSSFDLHHGEAWDRIAANPALIARYNALKRDFEGGSVDEYRAAKREFFYAVLGRSLDGQGERQPPM